jgi:hypothetical protein
MARTITVTIAAGKAVVQTEGYQGAACKDATAALQKALGATETDDPTPEFHERDVRTANQ